MPNVVFSSSSELDFGLIGWPLSVVSQDANECMGSNALDAELSSLSRCDNS